MPMPEVSPESMPLWQQIILGAGIFIGGALAAIRQWSKGRAGEPHEAAKQIVLESASLSDMRPLREMQVDIHAIREILENQAEEREDGARIKLMIREELADVRPPARRRARPRPKT